MTDLDGTLLGDDDALARFREWLRTRRDGHRLVYASGRHLGSVQALTEEGLLPEADAVISGVGVQIHDPTGRPWPGWEARFDGWDADRVRRTLRPFGWLRPQADVFQTPLKASYEVAGLSTSDRATIAAALRRAGLDAILVYSGGRFVDVLPARAGKGRAAGFLAEGWGVPAARVLAFGDSGNDAELLTSGFRGTVVANALPELIRVVGPDVYRSPEPYADGVLDGIRFWSAR